MAILSVQNVSMNFGEKKLLDDICFEIEDRDKVGFIGANGVGKTTLFKIINGTIEPASGNVIKSSKLHVGYLQQHACEGSNRSVYDELLSVFDYLAQIEKELENINTEIEIGKGDIDYLIKKQIELRELFERENGLTYKSRTYSALKGFGFSENDFNMPVRNLSGGQRSKLSLLKLLLSRSDLLLLDEPTNHLDIPSLQWLEEFIRDFKGAVIIISHDRYFLDLVTNKTIELKHLKTTVYKGNYSEFMKKKEKITEDARNIYKNKLKEIKRIENIVDQQRRWGQAHNFITAASKQKQADRLKQELVKPEEEIAGINFSFSPWRECGNEVLVCENIGKSFGEKQIFSNVSFTLRKGEKVFILGSNGVGKTTLFKILIGEISDNDGTYRWGSNVDIGYFEQVQENMNAEKTALDEVWDNFPRKTQTEIRTALGRFLFKDDDVFKKIKELSGGERSRIALLKLMLKCDNCLLLDEPTNHLDTLSREALEDTLQEYRGTMLIVSHDRYFINKLADRILVIEQNGIKEYIGNYDYYLEKTKDKITVSNKNNVSDKKKTGGLEYKQRKERLSDFRKLNTRLNKCEMKIDTLENKINELKTKLTDENVVSDYTLLTQFTQELDEVNFELESEYSKWEALQEEIADFTNSDV